jgi:hypothetical protein
MYNVVCYLLAPQKEYHSSQTSEVFKSDFAREMT